MALLTVANVSMAIGQRVLLDEVNLALEPGEHVGLVGLNGCGKSCLLRAIVGSPNALPLTNGQIQLQRGSKVGLLSQDPDVIASNTLRQEAGRAFEGLAQLHEQLEHITEQMAHAQDDAMERLLKQYEKVEHEMQLAGGYAVDHKIDATLHGLGLTDDFFEVLVGDLSGGQRGRLALAKLLLSEPDLLLLDEPTNHLDIQGRQWLEDFLAGYRGAVMVVSHDRWLLDRSVCRIVELEHASMVDYPGNYSKYRSLREERYVAQQRAYAKQQQDIKKQRQFIAQYKAGQRAKQAKGREKRLERFISDDAMQRPLAMSEISVQFAPVERSGDMVLYAENISKAYGDNSLFGDFTFTVKRGDRIGIIGPNGTGKSTLVSCMLGLTTIDAGKVRTGSQVDVGFFRQTHDHLNQNQSIVEYLQRCLPSNNEQQARDLAGAFLFAGIDQDKLLCDVSGGERSRTVLAGMVVQGHNLLILDEPSNHLDIPSVERLEQAVDQFTTGKSHKDTPGTLLLISHDRMLLDRLVDQLLIVSSNGSVRHFMGNYSAYLEAGAGSQKQKPSSADVQRKSSAKPKVTPAKQSAKKPAKQSTQSNKNKNQTPSKSTSKSGKTSKQSGQPRGSITKLNSKKLEQTLAQTQSRIAEIDSQMLDPQVLRDGPRIKMLQQERVTLSSELSVLEEEWLRRADD